VSPRNAFRIRVQTPPTAHISSDESSVVLNTSFGEISVEGDAKKRKSSRTLVFSGRGFRAEHDATEAAERLRAALQLGPARLRLGADFGERGPGDGSFSSDAKEAGSTSRSRRGALVLPMK